MTEKTLAERLKGRLYGRDGSFWKDARSGQDEIDRICKRFSDEEPDKTLRVCIKCGLTADPKAVSCRLCRNDIIEKQFISADRIWKEVKP